MVRRKNIEDLKAKGTEKQDACRLLFLLANDFFHPWFLQCFLIITQHCIFLAEELCEGRKLLHRVQTLKMCVLFARAFSEEGVASHCGKLEGSLRSFVVG